MEMMKTRYISLLLLAAPAMQGAAQYDQDIDVEGKYVPEFIARDRIGLFPRPVKFPLEKSALEYSLAGVHADFTPQAIPISATGWKDTRRWDDSRGYLSLGLGSWLESTLSAGYRFIDSGSTVAGIRLQHNSTSLWKPDMPSMPDTRMWRYDEAVGIYASHNFEGKGRLDVSADYHIGNFNYYGYDPYYAYDLTSAIPDGTKAPDQTLNDFSARVAWSSPSAIDDMTWNAAAGVRYFGYRRMYLPWGDGTFASLTGGRETHFDLDAGFAFPTSSKSSLGIDLEADVLGYAAYKNRDGAYADAASFMPEAPDTYGMVSLTPYYRFTRSRLDIRVGARIDLTFNAGTEGDRYRVFHIAPDVKLDYNAGPASLFLHLTGGNTLHTLAGTYDLDYYQAPGIFSSAPTYTPLDAKAGVTFGPFSGFHAGFDIAWRTSRGQYWGGLYQMALNGTDPVIYGAPEEIEGQTVAYSYSLDASSRLSGISVGLQAGYDAGRYFSISASGHYQPQNGTKGYFNGFDRPRWVADAAVETNPWSSLRFRVGLDWRGVRSYPIQTWNPGSSALNGGPVVMLRIPDLVMLNLGASYDVTDSFGIWIQADNLLNRDNLYAPSLPEPGIRLAAGIDLKF